MATFESDADFRMLAAAQPAVEDWCVLMGWRGSVAHGTYVPSEDLDAFDDRDLMGIAIPPIDYYTGLKELGSRGTVEAKEGSWDIVIYEHRKALRLLAKGNPNVLCLLWLPESLYLWRSPAANLLLEHRALFSTRAAYPAFRGYAQGSLRKMFSGSYQGYMGKKRKELFDRYGYDVKQASHLIRILRQGIEFLGSGEMQVQRDDADELLEIKHGEWSLDAVRRAAESLDAELAMAGERCKLPDSPDLESVNALSVEMADLAMVDYVATG